MIDQLVIAATSVPAVFLSQAKTASLRRYACLFGAAGQPFWFYTTFTHEQWGMFGLCFFYAYAWGMGVRNNWFAKKNPGAVKHRG